MKLLFIGLSHGVFLLAFLHGQLAFAVPSVFNLIDSDCGQDLDIISANLHHDQHHAPSNGATPCEHGQHTGYQACDEDNGQCDHSCKGDVCCGGCNVCRHYPTATVAAPEALVPIAGYQPCGISLRLQDPTPLRSSNLRAVSLSPKCLLRGE
jgi:hypothetical protein